MKKRTTEKGTKTKSKARAGEGLEQTGARKTTGKDRELTPDEVMLNPEYLKKLREEVERKKIHGRLPTIEEMTEMFKSKDIFDRMITMLSKPPEKGLTISPIFTLKIIEDKRGKGRIIPFIGIKGTF